MTLRMTTFFIKFLFLRNPFLLHSPASPFLSILIRSAEGNESEIFYDYDLIWFGKD